MILKVPTEGSDGGFDGIGVFGGFNGWGLPAVLRLYTIHPYPWRLPKRLPQWLHLKLGS